MEISSKDLSLNEKLKILADAAKYDVACTSSGSSRRGKKGMLGNTEAAGICHRDVYKRQHFPMYM